MFARSALLASMALLVAHAAAAAEEPAPSAASTPVVTAPAASAPGDVAIPAEERSLPQGRILNGHVFMPSAIVPGALTTTSFAAYLEIALGKTNSTVQVGDRVYSGSYDYAGVGAILGYEYAFLKYFSARISLNEIIYSGIDGDSVVAIGTNVGIAAALGLTASVPIGDSLRVGVLFDAGITPGFGLTIGNGLKTLIQNCQAGDCNFRNNDALFKKNNATTIQPALAANWAPWRALGLTANVAYLHVSQDRTDGTFTGDGMSMGAAADFDFRAISSVPIGLQLAVSWTAPISGTTTLQHVTDLGGGIFYTGREHLALGMQLITRRFAVQPNVDVSWSTYLSTIGLRYYW